jgi:hypothetical protein
VARSAARAARDVNVIFVLAVVGIALATCRARQADAVGQGAPIQLGFAAVQYDLHEPVEGTAEVRLIVGNRTGEPTESTSIRLDPLFSARFSFVASDTPTWRVRVDDAGCATVDTAGVPAGQDGRFVARFRENSAGAETGQDAPLWIEVVAHGELVAGPAVASAAHAPERARLARQQTFDRAPLAPVADHLEFLPASGRWRPRSAVAIASALLAATVAGAASAVRTAAAHRGAES